MANLEIQIGADSSELNAEIAAAEAKIKRLGKLKVERIKLGLDTKEITFDINHTKSQLKGLDTSLHSTGKSFDAMKKPVANGGNTLMQFSRIAQDAPYGMIGIQNNLTATAEGFAHLSASSGGAGNALKAVASSIMGVGGILLAVSLVTSALTYMSQNGITVGDVFDKLTGKFDATANAVRKVGEESAKSAGEEISSLKSLISVAQDDTLSRENRLIAVRNLQKAYPAYFQNLTDEKILNGDLTGIINQLSNALKARARASALSGKAGESAAKELIAQEKIRDVYKEIFDILKIPKSKQLEAINDLNKENLDLNNKRFSALKTLSSLEILQLGRLKSEYTDLRGEISEAGKELNRFQSLADKDTKASISLEVTTTDLNKGKLKDNKATDFKGTKQSFGGGFIGGGIVNPNLGLVTPDLGIDEYAIAANEKLRLALELQKKTIQDFNNELGSIVTNGTVNALAGIGEAIGGALSSGGNVIDAVGKSILASMGSMLQELGKATIAYGVGLIAVKAAIKNPYLAVAAGVAMVALGSAMSKSVSKSSSSALGGGGGGSVQGGNSVSSPTSSIGSSGGGGFSGGTVVFEISGQSLVGVLSNTLDKNRRLGGSLSIG